MPISYSGLYRAVILPVFLLLFLFHSSVSFAQEMEQGAFEAKLIPIIRSFSLKDYDTAINQIKVISAGDLSQAQKNKLNTILAECYLYTNREDSVAPIINEFKKSTDPYYSAYAVYLEGRVLFIRQDYEKALSKFKQAVSINDNDNNIYPWIAQASLVYTKQTLANPSISQQDKNISVENYKKTVEDIKNALIQNNMRGQAYEIAYISYAQLAIEPEMTQSLVDYVTYAPSIDNVKELYQTFYMNRDYLSNLAMLDSLSGFEFASQSEFVYMHGKSMISYGLNLMNYTLSDIEVAAIEGGEPKYGADRYMNWINEGVAKYNIILNKEKTSSPLYKQVIIEELSLYLSIHQLDKAIVIVHANRGMDMGHPEIARMFGVISFYAGEDKQGLKYMDKALEMATAKNDNASLNYIYDSLSAYYGYHGDYQMSRQYSDKALAANYEEDRLRLLYNRFFCFKKLPDGQSEAAKIRAAIISDYAKNNQELSNDERAMVLLMLSDESIERNQYDRAIEYARYAQSLSPTVADSYYYVALGLYKKQDYKTALKWLQRAEFYEPADPQYIYLESLTHTALGDKAAAQADMKRVKAKAPGFVNGL